MKADPFEGRHFPKDIILQCVRWYQLYRLSSSSLSEMMLERGVKVDNSTIWRWSQTYGPEIEKRARPYLKATNDSYRVDETYIKVKDRDQNASYPPAIDELKADGILPANCEIRQCKYLNNIVEQDHRFIKWRVKAMLGFGSFHTSSRALRGIEIINIIRKGQIQSIDKGDIIAQLYFIDQLFAVAA